MNIQIDWMDAKRKKQQMKEKENFNLNFLSLIGKQTYRFEMPAKKFCYRMNIRNICIRNRQKLNNKYMASCCCCCCEKLRKRERESKK